MATKKTKTKSKTKEKQTTVKTKTKTKHSTVKEDATTKKIEEPVNGDERYINEEEGFWQLNGDDDYYEVAYAFAGGVGDGQLYVEHMDDESEGDGFIDYDSDDVEGLDDSEDERAAGLDDGDPNDQYFPLAFGVVETETKESWKWFIELLMKDIGQDNRYVFISDQQKGLVAVFEEMFQRVEHRLCLRHLYANFKKKFGGGTLIRDLMMGAAKATYYQAWEAKMSELKAHDKKA
ncbi:hypothetical protein P8452_72159 [Trifolium repens]|nr:hypothetical protein P8452_72159 [Trifolium repens]